MARFVTAKAGDIAKGANFWRRADWQEPCTTSICNEAAQQRINGDQFDISDLTGCYRWLASNPRTHHLKIRLHQYW